VEAVLKVTRIPRTRPESEGRRLTVAAYCRVSTGQDDQLASLEAQKRHYDAFIKANPEWEYAGVYVDEGISGTKRNGRKGLRQLLSDCESRKVDLIVTKSISRFARNTTDCLEMVRRLLDIGIFIFFEKENIHTGSMDGELVLTILSSIAENESASTSLNYKWGVQKRFRNGTFKLSYAPYGYDCIAGRLAINREQAETVHRIFREALAGYGSDRIAAGLNADGIPARRGQGWDGSTVLGLLRNEKYTGNCLLQKVYSDEWFNQRRNHGERDRYLIQGSHEALISQEDFEAVAALLGQRGKDRGVEVGKRMYQHRYPSSGKIRCGGCGGTFKRRSACRKKKRQVTWCCSNHLKDISQCSMLPVREDAIEQAFVVMMNKLVFGRELILKPLRQALMQRDANGSLSQIQELESGMEENSKRSHALAGLMAMGCLDAAHYISECNALKASTGRLKERIRCLYNAADNETNVLAQADQLYRYASTAEPTLDSFDDELFDRFVAGVEIYSSSEVGFRMKCGITLRESLDY
jgi:site-specific DNA recombinase